MAHPSHMSPDNILRFLQVKNGPASATEIAQGLHLKKSDNRPLFKMLSKLKKRRAIEELPGGRYRLPSRKPERESPGQKSLQEDAARHPQSSPLAGRDEVKGRLVLHYDVRIQHEIEIPRGNELTPGLWKKLGFSGADETSIRSRRIPRLDELDGAVVNVELLRYPHGGASPTGRVIEILVFFFNDTATTE